MAVVTKCPSCGLESSEMRCPRCFALKVTGCTGSCALCADKKKHACGTDDGVPGARPSDSARDDEDHPGTPLER